MGLTTTHWPEEANVPGLRKNREDLKFIRPELTPEQKKLIPMNN